MTGHSATTTEQALIKIWEGIFQGGQPIVSSDDFFSLGGDSIQMMMMIIEVSRIFGVELSPEQIFENASLAEVAARVDQLLVGAGSASQVVERGYL